MTEPSRSPRALAAVVLAVIVLVAHARVVLGGMTWEDLRYHTVVTPPRLAAADAILAGEPPTWWEGTGFGVPLVGELSHGAAYPLTWIAATPTLFDLVVVLHLLWLALGIAAWSRRLGASELASVVAGALIATSGLAVSAGLRSALPALAHLPWVAIAASAIGADGLSRRRTGAIVALGLLLGLIGLAGEPALLLDAVLITIVVGVGERASLTSLAISIVAGLAIACAQLVPAIAAAGDLTGASLAGPLALSRLVELVLPGSFGASDAAHGVAAIAGEAPAWPSLFVSAVPFALAALARPAGRSVGLVLGLLVATLVVGRFGAWPAWAGAPELHLAVIAIVVIAHAGPGFDELVDHDGDGRRRIVALAVAAAITALAVGAAGMLRARGTTDAGLERALVDGGLAVTCLVAALAITWRVEAAWRTLALAALLVAPSLGSLGGTAPLVSRATVRETPTWASAARTTIDAANPRLPLRVFRPAKLYDAERDETLADAMATLAGTSPSQWGIGTARSEDPARPRIHDALWFAANGAGGAFLERFGITLAVLPGAVVGQRSLAEVARRGKQVLVHYPAAPAAAMVFEWFWVFDASAAIPRLFPPGAGRGLPGGVAVLTGRGVEQQDEPRTPETCHVTRWARGAIDLTCASEDRSYAIVSSTSMPGWTVEVDGSDTPWVTADAIRRAVPLEAGAHVVSWRYIAPGGALGLAIAMTAFVALLGTLALLALVRRGRPPDDGAN